MADRCDDPLFGEIPPRVLLENAPLVRVLGQVRFPKIVKISEESYIADFQEALRKEYPHFQSDVVKGVELNLTGEDLQHRIMSSVIWRFFDPSRAIRVSLAQDAITLETASYVSRDDFLERMGFILDCLSKSIAPSLVERVGFRYVDRLQGEDTLELLAQLIQPELLNVLQPNLTSKIDISMTEITGATAEGKLIARYGLAPAGFSHDPEVAPPVEVRSWVLDVDSYSTNCAGQEFNAQMLHAELDKVAARAYAFFRWSITEEFLERFGVNQ
ncbi:TIGR04255 family protein [Phaeobacter sp. CNT1-3]|nr:TIGR04255 family protein [Phaeobacter sp. CNT1-3]